MGLAIDLVFRCYSAEEQTVKECFQKNKDMFIDIVEKVFINPNGEKTVQETPAILLRVGEQSELVPVKKLNNFYLDTEYLNDASWFYFDYKGNHYKVPVPDKDSADWEVLQEIFDPE